MAPELPFDIRSHPAAPSRSVGLWSPTRPFIGRRLTIVAVAAWVGSDAS
jgi:hypothetical protein